MDEKEIKKLIDDLTTRVGKLEAGQKRGTLVDHIHNGFDASKVRVQDLDFVWYKNATLDPANLADGAGETLQVTGVTGATLGDFVLVAAPYDLQDITVTAYVQANSVVEIRIQNESGGAVDLASGTWRMLGIRKIV